MNKKSVRPDEIAAIISAELTEYSAEVAESVREDVKTVAKSCVKEIQKNSPDKTGEYKKGWRLKVEYDGRNGIKIRIYNAKKPGLTHLLEFGHAKTGGGRVVGKPHIYPAREKAAKLLEKKAKVSIKG